ncbi:MAG: tRNA (5-methylaminomethyl-2-thiouridine)(34)-methyltransferase MnmD [Saprospiraceae bacterium]|nr:tRNA (5-methylaminomethyl-2-thiouridine)(34)-methyltransferase MnmD [Saprospiraceae bacterium]
MQLTKDHSPTLFSDRFQAFYHSTHGALTETEHVFIKAGLEKVIEKSSFVSILEIGFGTGLNAFATITAKPENIGIHYTALEKYPLRSNEVKLFMNALHLTDSEKEVFRKLHQCRWNITEKIETGFDLLKLETDFLDFKSHQSFNLVYFDAFAPDVQPELWTITFFEELYLMMKSGGVLTTYCAKGYVKRNLKAAGFILEALPGPPGKREMTRATKPLI